MLRSNQQHNLDSADENISLLSENKVSVNIHGSRQNVRSIVYAGIVICIIFSIVGSLSYVLEAKNSARQSPDGERLQLDSVIQGKWYAASTEILWKSTDTNKFIYTSEAQDYILAEVADDGTIGTQTILTKVKSRSLGCYYCDLKFSADLKYCLIPHDKQQVFRHSYTARYKVVNLRTKHVYPIEIPVNKDFTESVPSYARLKQSIVTRFRHAQFGKVGNQLFLYTGQVIYFKPKAIDIEVHVISNIKIPSESSQLPQILAGIPDWVYEEEIFGTGEATWFSDDGRYAAWAEFNDTKVENIEIPRYNLLTPSSKGNSYPEQIRVPYPKSGTTNPMTKLFITDLTSLKTVQVPTPQGKSLKTSTGYTILWVVQYENNKLFATWSNRIQNNAVTIECTLESSGDTNLLCHNKWYRSASNGWLSDLEAPFQSTNLAGIWLDYCDDYKKIVTTVDNTCLTPDKMNVYKILGVQKKKVYYQGQSTIVCEKENRAGNAIYSTDMESRETVEISEKFPYPDGLKGDEGGCKSWKAEIVGSGNFALVRCTGPIVPFSYLLKLDNMTIVDTIIMNNELRTNVKKTYLPKAFRFNVTLGGATFSAQLKVPFDFDFTSHQASNIKTYPLLVDVYAGPSQIKVTHDYGVHFNDWLVTTKELALLEIDGRGSLAGNMTNLHSVYKNLGEYEIIDQIEGARQALARFPQLDNRYVGIWGWSYGGYSTLRVLTQEIKDKPDVFTCGASVAPVADWKLYDTMYTERWMDTPTKNPVGYDKSSLIVNSRLSRMTRYNGSYLLVHGTFDDNVHFQNSAMLETKLVEYGVRHRVQFYTDKTHSLGGRETQTHLYNLLTEHFDTCFQTSTRNIQEAPI